MIKVLHITPDDKFFDAVFAKWNDLGCFHNEALLISNDKSHSLRYIKSTENLQVMSDDYEVSCKLATGDYQVLYFHSLSPQLYKFFQYIPKDKIVIWWAWGFDLYYENLSPKPFIHVNLYKPFTNNFSNIRDFSSRILAELRIFVKDLLVKRRVKSIMNRIDYFQPVTKIEYTLMQQVKGFHAKEFYYDGSLDVKYEPIPRNPKGAILIGNSATTTNNHLDVIQYVDKNRQDGQKIIMPLNYGGEDNYLDWLKGRIAGIKNLNALLDFLPSEEYFKLMDSCSYACYGVIRQQALGNIRYALSKGIKVFLFKDSIPYRSLKEMGFVVFAIEDIDPKTLSTPLTLEDIERNRVAFDAEEKRRSAVYEVFLHEFELYK